MTTEEAFDELLASLQRRRDRQKRQFQISEIEREIELLETIWQGCNQNLPSPARFDTDSERPGRRKVKF